MTMLGPNEVEVSFLVNTTEGRATEASFAVDSHWPADWWDTKKHPDLWENYVIPAIQQLRQEAAYRAHGRSPDCLCHICQGEIDEPVVTVPA